MGCKPVLEEIEVRSDDTTKKIHETLCSRMVCSSVRGVHVYRICANDDVPVLKFLRKQRFKSRFTKQN